MIRKLFKWLLIAIFSFILLTIVLLKIVERSSDQLKVGFESYLTQQSGYPAEIGELSRVSFFPSFDLTARRVRLWPMDNPDGRVIYAEHVSVRSPLWSLLIGRPRFAEFTVDGLTVDESVTGIAGMALTSLTIDRERDLLTASGTIGDVSIEASVPLKRAAPGSDTYLMPRPPVRISGTLASGRALDGDYFIDLNKGAYGALATFSAYDPARLRPVQQLLEYYIGHQTDRSFAMQLHIERLNGQAGPYVVEAVTLENGRLQPLECFFNNRGRARPDRHPCAAYFNADTTPGDGS